MMVCALGIVASYLASKVGSATLGHLEDDGGLGIAGSLEGGNDGGGRGDVLRKLAAIRERAIGDETDNGGDGKLLLASVLEETENVIAVDDAGLAAQNISAAHDCGVCRERV